MPATNHKKKKKIKCVILNSFDETVWHINDPYLAWYACIYIYVIIHIVYGYAITCF